MCNTDISIKSQHFWNIIESLLDIALYDKKYLPIARQ